MTCGSALKLANSENNVRLHSHDVKYGSGSGQQVEPPTHAHNHNFLLVLNGCLSCLLRV